jgi:hypothetical protein
LNETDGASAVMRLGERNLIDRENEVRGGERRITPHSHRRWPGVRVLAFDLDIEPALTQRAGDNADR